MVFGFYMAYNFCLAGFTRAIMRPESNLRRIMNEEMKQDLELVANIIVVTAATLATVKMIRNQLKRRSNKTAN